MAEKSFAAQMLENLEGACLKLSKGTNATANFNGQNYTKKNLPELLAMRTQMRDEVAAEEAAGKTGEIKGRRVVTRFVDNGYSPGSPYPRTRPL